MNATLHGISIILKIHGGGVLQQFERNFKIFLFDILKPILFHETTEFSYLVE